MVVEEVVNFFGFFSFKFVGVGYREEFVCRSIWILLGGRGWGGWGGVVVGVCF